MLAEMPPLESKFDVKSPEITKSVVCKKVQFLEKLLNDYLSEIWCCKNKITFEVETLI